MYLIEVNEVFELYFACFDLFCEGFENLYFLHFKNFGF